MNPVVEVVIVLGMVLFTGALAAMSLAGLINREPWELDTAIRKRKKAS